VKNLQDSCVPLTMWKSKFISICEHWAHNSKMALQLPTAILHFCMTAKCSTWKQ